VGAYFEEKPGGSTAAPVMKFASLAVSQVEGGEGNDGGESGLFMGKVMRQKRQELKRGKRNLRGIVSGENFSSRRVMTCGTRLSASESEGLVPVREGARVGRGLPQRLGQKGFLGPFYLFFLLCFFSFCVFFYNFCI
jgi:hypothetical protein